MKEDAYEQWFTECFIELNRAEIKKENGRVEMIQMDHVMHQYIPCPIPFQITKFNNFQV